MDQPSDDSPRWTEKQKREWERQKAYEEWVRGGRRAPGPPGPIFDKGD